MWRARMLVALVVVATIVAVLLVFWRENERRYANLLMTGCFGDSARSPLGATQECTGARRVCRDSPPLFDWRHYCE